MQAYMQVVIDLQVDRQAYIGLHAYKQADRRSYRQTSRYPGRQTNKYTHRQVQANRQIYIQVGK